MAQECREVINNGVAVATVCMDSGTTESQWESALSPYRSLTGIPEVPMSVTPYGLRRAMRELEVLGSFISMVENQSQSDQDKWEYAVEFQRNDLLVKTICDSLGYTSAFVDSIFRKAAGYS